MISILNSKLNLSLDFKVVCVLLIKIMDIFLFILQITMNFTNFNLINGFLILCYVITELNEIDNIDVKKDLIKIILQLLSLLYVYVYMLHLNF